MKEQDKQLLLKDLCARLTYGVKCRFISSKGDIPSTIVKVDIENETVSHKPEGQSVVYFHWIESGNIKPYLRPMSSMTEKEREDWYRQSKVDYDCEFKPEPTISLDDCHLSTDWLNEHHFDYRGLIERGLALEAPEGMYKTE